MRYTKSKRSQPKRDINLTDITYTSTCIDLNLPSTLQCSTCSLKSDPLKKKSSHKEKRFRNTSERRRCRQPWASVHGLPTATTSTNILFCRVRQYLKIDNNVTIKQLCVYSNKKRKCSEISNETEHPTKPNFPSKLSTLPSEQNRQCTSDPTLLDGYKNKPPIPIILNGAEFPACCASCTEKIAQWLSKVRSEPTNPPSEQSTDSTLVPTHSEDKEDAEPSPEPTFGNKVRIEKSDFRDRLYTKILTSQYNQLQHDAKLGRIIRTHKKKQRHYLVSTPLGRRLLAMAVVHAPKVGLETMQKIVSLVSAGTLANLGLDEGMVQYIPNILPCANSLKRFVFELGCDIVMKTSNEIKNKELALICDKGENKGNAASFVKLLCWVSDRGAVDVCCFGIESAGNKSDDAAKAIHHSLKLFELSMDNPVALKVNSSTTDAGGGGVGLKLVQCLALHGRADNNADYDWATCVLHAMNLMLKCPIEEIFGAGGLKKRTFLQMLHTAYNLRQQYTSKTWKAMWKIVTGTEWVDIKCPILSRWEHVGEAAEHVLKYKEQWIKMCETIIQMNNVGTNKNDISSYLFSYLHEPMLIAQLSFVHGYIHLFFDKHFQWHKQIDKKSKRAGFRAFDMAVNTYVMNQDLEKLKSNWRAEDAFAEFIRNYPTESSYSIDNMANDFFGIVQQRMNKHMLQWRSRNLYFALGGDILPAAYLASWFLGEEPPTWLPSTYYSYTHDCLINVRECGAYLVKETTLDDHRGKAFLQMYRNELIMMMKGTADLWNEECSERMSNFREYMINKCMKTATNSQLAERWVKDSNELTYTGKDEKFSNIMAIVRSRTVMKYNDEAYEQHRARIRKSSLYYTEGALGERIDKRTGLMESGYKKKRDEIRGAMLASFIINETIALSHEMKDVKTETKQALYAYLTGESTQFNSFCLNEEINSFHSIKDKPHKAPNKIQRMSGFDSTAYTRKEIRFSNCLKRHLALIKAELRFRNLVYDERMGINALKLILKEDERKIKAQQFILETNLPPREEDIDEKYFRPQHCPAVEWRDAYHAS